MIGNTSLWGGLIKGFESIRYLRFKDSPLFLFYIWENFANLFIITYKSVTNKICRVKYQSWAINIFNYFEKQLQCISTLFPLGSSLNLGFFTASFDLFTLKSKSIFLNLQFQGFLLRQHWVATNFSLYFALKSQQTFSECFSNFLVKLNIFVIDSLLQPRSI